MVARTPARDVAELGEHYLCLPCISVSRLGSATCVYQAASAPGHEDRVLHDSMTCMADKAHGL